PLLLVRPQIINTINTGDGTSRYYLQATAVDQASSRLREVTIYDVSDPAISRTIYADSAQMRHTADGTDLVLVLYEGHIREVTKADPAYFQRMIFQEQVLRMPGVRQTLDRTAGVGFRTDRDMTAAMMRARIDTLRAELAELEAARGEALPSSVGVPEEISMRGETLPYTQARAGSILFRIRELQVEIQKKYA